MRVYTIGAIIPFPLGLYSNGHKNQVSSIGLSLDKEHSLNSCRFLYRMYYI